MSNSSDIKCSVCNKKRATKKLSIYVDDEHYSIGRPEMDALLEKIRRIYREEQEQERPPRPEQEEQSTPPAPTPNPDQTPLEIDKWGIKKIYPDSDKTNPLFLTMDMDNPTKDSFLNKEEKANLKKESDGSWSLDGKDTGKYQVRLGLWMQPPQVNIEATIYANFIEVVAGQESGSYAFQLYKGVGDHSTSNNGCTGFAYKARIRHDKSVVICKEITHPNYSSNVGGVRKLTKEPKGNYIGTKLVIYNMSEKNGGGRTPVRIQVYCDESGMNAQGVLDPTKQNWVKMAEYIDKGGFNAGSASSVGNCEPLEIGNNTGKRKTDEIYNLPVGTKDKGNIITYRTDSARTKVKYFSVRGISVV